MSWTKVSGATSYMVYHKLTSASVYTNSANLGDVSSYTITGLTASTSYHVTVTAINSAGTSPMSTVATVTTGVAIPIAPSNLVEVTKTDTQISVTWSKSTGATSYMVYHKLTSSSVWINSANLGDFSSYTITGLTASTSYHVTVTATNISGTSPKSTFATLTTSVAIPIAPSNLVEVSKIDTQMTVSWSRSIGAT